MAPRQPNPPDRDRSQIAPDVRGSESLLGHNHIVQLELPNRLLQKETSPETGLEESP